MKVGRYGLLVLLLLAGCPSSDQKWAKSVAEGFLKNVFEGNLDASSIYTVADFKYEDWNATRDMLKGRTWTITSEKVSPNGDEAFFEGTWEATPTKGTLAVRVVKQESKWRVDKFNAHKD